MGVPVAGGGCVVLAAMLFIKARRDRDILEMMVATGREALGRGVPAFEPVQLPDLGSQSLWDANTGFGASLLLLM